MSLPNESNLVMSAKEIISMYNELCFLRAENRELKKHIKDTYQQIFTNMHDNEKALNKFVVESIKNIVNLQEN